MVSFFCCHFLQVSVARTESVIDVTLGEMSFKWYISIDVCDCYALLRLMMRQLKGESKLKKTL